MAARAALEKLMASGNYEFQSDFAKRFIAKGEARGRAEGESKGRVEGSAHAILHVLEARGVHVSDEARARILACTDEAQLATWLRKAAKATSIDQVLLGESQPRLARATRCHPRPPRRTVADARETDTERAGWGFFVPEPTRGCTGGASPRASAAS